MKFSLLINMKMSLIVGIFIFITRDIFMLDHSRIASNSYGHKILCKDVDSCIKFYEHSYLKPCLNGLEVMFKQQNPCSNHEIHMLFEDGF